MAKTAPSNDPTGDTKVAHWRGWEAWRGAPFASPAGMQRAWSRIAARGCSQWTDVRALLSGERLPLILLASLLFVALLTVVTQAHTYGIAVDEPLQQQYGERVLAWYRTLGKDTSFLTAFPQDTHMPEHGGIFDAGVAAVQALFSGLDPWLVRRIVTGLSGLMGIVAIALCGYELGCAWVGLVAALGLWLYPRYTGAIYNNPKDVPAAVAMTFVLWATLLLVKRWGQPQAALRAGVLLGICLGVAAAIRVTAVTWYGVLAVLLACWWLIHAGERWREGRIGAELLRQGILAGGIALISFATMALLWPYVFLDPLANLVRSIQVLSHYPWHGLVLYQGVEYRATQLPADYVPTWLVIGSPPALVLLALLGLGLALAMPALTLARTRRIDPVDPGDPALWTVALAFVIPIATLVVLHPVLYDGLRQFLYVVPPMILLAGYGLVRAVSVLWGERRTALRWAVVGLLAVTLASYAQVAAEMATLAPYEYAYFSPLVGDLAGAASGYDTDYWATCSKGAAEWLAAHYQSYTRLWAPTVQGPVVEGITMQGTIAPFVPATFREDDSHPDFVVAITRDHNDRMYPTYRVIHTVAAEGVTLCVVKVNPAVTSG